VEIAQQMASADTSTDTSTDFDLVVLGAGTGGYTAAFRAGQLGLRVALVDEDKIGGTCLHRGCIPTKALLESAATAHRIRTAGDLGVTVGKPSIDYPGVAAHRDQVVQRLWTGLRSLVAKNKVSWIAGRGRLDGPGKVVVALSGEDGAPGAGGERTLSATDVIIATGSRVKSLPGLEPDGRRILTSDDVLKMDKLPADIVIVGAGAVGVEFASFFHDVGVKVTLLEYLPAVVPLEDDDVSAALLRSFTKRGITVMTNARFDAAAVKVGKNGVRLTVGPEGGTPSEIRAEVLLVATGRAANIEDIGLETTSVETERGVIKVDARMRTREPHVYAIGDVVGGLWLAHVAGHEGLTAVHTIVGDPDVADLEYDAQPRATYCRPEIASIGLTEEQCRSRSLAYKVGRVPFQAIAKALIAGETEGFAKVIADPETGDTLGVHIIGPHATDLIAEASLGLHLEASAWEIGGATHPHPTLSEVLGEAALAVDRRSINF
jgi:dihydrolipoamide dehydrogenase